MEVIAFSGVSYTITDILRDKSLDLLPRQINCQYDAQSQACITKGLYVKIHVNPHGFSWIGTECLPADMPTYDLNRKNIPLLGL